MLAQIAATAMAVFALATSNDRIDGDTLSDLKADHSFAKGNDLAADFMTEHYRRPGYLQFPVEYVHIGTADATESNFDKSLVLLWFWLRDILYLDLSSPQKNGGSHSLSPLWHRFIFHSQPWLARRLQKSTRHLQSIVPVFAVLWVLWIEAVYSHVTITVNESLIADIHAHVGDLVRAPAKE